MTSKYNDYKIHIAKKGDSVQSICTQYSVSENDLVKANPGINIAPFGGGFFSAPKFRLDIKQGDHVRIPFHNKDKDKKGVKTISGKKSVKVGVWENYEVTEWYDGTPKEDRNESKVKWDLYLMKNGAKPELVLQKEEGKIRFQEKAIGNKFKVVGYLHEPESNNSSAILINVEAAEKREILNIKVSDSKNQPIKGPLAYGQDINVHVETTGMKGEYVYISLWEDDVNGSGHSSSQNSKNKVIKDKKSLVGTKGVAHEIFKIEPDFKKIANAYLSKGDSSEGSTHEYYVTAYASGESKASPNINVRNPDYQKKRKEETQDHLGDKKTKPKPSVPDYKGPVGSKRAPQNPNPTQTKSQVGISSIYITDGSGNKITKSVFGNKIRVYIESSGLKGKKVRLWLYEHDSLDANDELFKKDITITGDNCYETITLTNGMKDKGNSWEIGEDGDQELFAEAKVLDVPTHIISKSLKADITSTQIVVAENVTVAKVGDSKPSKRENEKKTCICKEQYADLIWGANVSCEFRKKVVAISKRLGKDPNLLMAAMALETGKTFSPTAGKGTSYIGLIQFGADTAASIGTTQEALLKMTALEQLDYVEKHLIKKKDKLTTLTDFYMSILMPVDVGRGDEPNHIVFDNKYPLAYKKDGKTLTDLSKSRHFGYRQNPAFFFEKGEREHVNKNGKKKYDGEGKTYIWEIEKFLSYIYNEGKNHKAKIFTCEKGSDSKPVITESGTWNVVITEKYTGDKCEHEKPRKNCRRGKIDVYDHNKKIVFTIADCLLEGVAGENRMITNSDAPYGTYSISSSPFIMGSSSGQKRISYGPNPRLSFEPINGSGDEADKSNRSLIRIHGGRQEDKSTYKPLPNPVLKRTQGCIRVYDTDAKKFYDWWVKFHKTNPNVKPGKLKIVK